MLAEIARVMGGKACSVRTDLARGVTIDSRETRPGHLFFALKGQHTDGHNFVNDALARGAIAAVVERTQSKANEIQVSDALYALGEFARHYRQYYRAKAIGITGTNGKTTVKKIVAAILGSGSNVLCTKRNYNSLIGMPLTIFNLCGDEDYMVLEMGTSAPGEIKRLCDIAKPDVGVITNIGPGHLEGLESLDGVRKEKSSLIEALPPDGLALVGEGFGEMPGRTVNRFSMDMLESVKLTEHGSYFSLGWKEYFTRLLGAGNVYNCLAAVCLTTMLGVDYATQKTALAGIKPEPGRLEPIRISRLLILNDTYNANPTSMKAAIDFIGQLGRPTIAVLGDMLELGKRSSQLHEEIGLYARSSVDLLMTYGRQSEYYGGGHYTEENELLRSLHENITGDEVILFKASRALRFERFVYGLSRLLR
ncbi:MAG: UDP-N-acetylmuramoyl-tripeptide--D-alanyl-D-alanine ligase [candidate division WOR-3 bacterium]|nr:UDP-N-acetylmuramoyl-tripeptide--D-alanyl-D-alanine ligase [candidate division WOR-3 bacterium]